MNKQDNRMNRRDFLKIVGISTAGTAAALTGCSPKESAETSAQSPVPTGKMTYRNFPPSKDQVSILGYGCMRWPTLPAPEKGGNVIDQEEVNRLIDYAIEHGVNYFDTAPVYVQGWSETSTGIALKRHPREKYFIATKMSNFDLTDFKSSVEMYHDSMKKLQTDYIDYYLLHSLGNTGKRSFQNRFIDNGLLDYLVKEREAGRIRHLGWSFHGSKEEFDKILAYHEQVHWDFIQIQLNYSDWKHASGRNVNADYLYAEISKRNIPMVIMEPLQGGRLSKVPEHIVARLKTRNPENSVASWAFRFAGTPAHGAHRTERHDLHGASARQHPHLFAAGTAHPGGTAIPARYRRADAQIPHHPMQQLPILHALPLWHRHSGGIAPLQQMCKRGQYAAKQARPQLRRGTPHLPDRLRPQRAQIAQASHCIGCEQCNPHCPQYIDIPREMQRIDQYVEKLKQETL